MSTETRDTPDNPYRKRDPWGARAAVPQVFTVQAAPAPMRRVFKPIPDTSPAARSAAPAPNPERADRLHLTPVAEPYDQPPPPRAEPKPLAPAADLVTTRRPPFAGAAPTPAPERPRNSFVGAAPPAAPEPVRPVVASQVQAERPPAPTPAPSPTASRLPPFARSETAPQPTPAARPAPAPEPELKRDAPVAPRPVPAAAIAPPVGGFALERAIGGRRTGRPLPRGLLAASLLVLAGVAAIAVVVVIKPWAHHPSAVDALAAQSAKTPAPLTITPAADPFAANAVTQTAPTVAPAKTAAASLAPRTGHAASGAPGLAPSSADANATPPAADAASQPGAAQPAVAPPKAAATPIVVSPPPEMDAKPAAAPAPEPAKASPPPPKVPASELVTTSHLPGDSIGPHQ